MANKIIADPHDAPPVTYGVLRDLKDRIYELENRLAYNTSDQVAGSRGQDATTQSLSESVKELSARRIFGTEDSSTDTFTAGTTPAPWTGPIRAATTFTIDKPRLVRLDLSVHMNGLIQYIPPATLVNPGISARHYFTTGGVQLTYSPWSMELAAESGVREWLSISQRISFFDLQVFNPGTYTVGYQAYVLGSNGTGPMNFSQPRILVQILEPIGGF